MLDTTQTAAVIDKANDSWMKKAGEKIDRSRAQAWRTVLTPEQKRQADAISRLLHRGTGSPGRILAVLRENRGLRQYAVGHHGFPRARGRSENDRNARRPLLAEERRRAPGRHVIPRESRVSRATGLSQSLGTDAERFGHH